MTRPLFSLTVVAILTIGSALPLAAQQRAPAVGNTQTNSASRVVLDNSTRILATLESRRAEFRRNPSALNSFINTEFNQLFDRDYSARLVLGQHQRAASDAEIRQFADAMAESLMKTYGTALLDFNTSLRVRVRSETALPGGRGVRVSTELVRSGGAPVPVDYLLRQVGGQWKLFDVMVEGVSYVQNFRNQLATPLAQRGIRTVTSELRSGRVQVDVK